MNITIYTRVSTEEQGDSRLGLDAQARVCDAYVAAHYPDAEVAYFEEVESGTVAQRPELVKALAHCRQTKGLLVVARHDRLTRLPAQCLTLLEEFANRLVDASNPHADEFQWGLNGLFAGRERKLISVRTTEALQSIRTRLADEGHYISKRGTRITTLGNPRPRRAAQISAQRSQARARANAQQYTDQIDELRKQGKTSFTAIAKGLNFWGIPAPRGGQWHHSSVRQVLAHLQP
jgi:DNA invertase Pin-like site-specific DNA recombinase